MGLQKEDSGKDTSCGLLCNDVLCVLWVTKRSETAATKLPGGKEDNSVLLEDTQN
jgi:hypothetical protein